MADRVEPMKDMLVVLAETSRTFYLPVTRLPAGLQESVASGYLCMRAIDEIEDHPTLSSTQKADLLQEISLAFQGQTTPAEFDRGAMDRALKPYRGTLPEVSLRLADWATLAPPRIAPRIWEAAAAMADRMAYWARIEWHIETVEDLDRYTFSVAGSVGILLCDLLAFFDGSQVDRSHAILFGRGLQLVNIVRNRSEDLARGIDFFPPGYTPERLMQYARECLERAESYAMAVPSRAFHLLYTIPLKLAYATLDALERGEAKLSREAVLALVAEADAQV
jgi:farnesyl-diphosphate farnesyltransferase